MKKFTSLFKLVAIFMMLVTSVSAFADIHVKFFFEDEANMNINPATTGWRGVDSINVSNNQPVQNYSTTRLFTVENINGDNWYTVTIVGTPNNPPSGFWMQGQIYLNGSFHSQHNGNMLTSFTAEENGDWCLSYTVNASKVWTPTTCPVATTSAVAEQIVKYSFAACPGGSGNFGSSPFAAESANANITAGGLTRHWSPLASGSGAQYAWGGNNFTATSSSAAITNGEYATFTIAAKTGYKVSLTSIEPYNIRRSGTGPSTGQWQYSIDGGEFVNIGTNITWGSATNTAGNLQSLIDLSGIEDLQNAKYPAVITFRVVLWGASGTGGTWYFNDHSASGVLGLPIKGIVEEIGGTPSDPCNEVSTAYAEDFTSYAGSAAPSDWTVSGDGTVKWVVNNAKQLYCRYNGNNVRTQITSPEIDLSAAPTCSKLYFSHAELAYQGHGDTLAVYYQIGEGSPVFLAWYSNLSSSLQAASLELPLEAFVSNFRLVFEQRASDANGTYVDNILIGVQLDYDIEMMPLLQPTYSEGIDLKKSAFPTGIQTQWLTIFYN